MCAFFFLWSWLFQTCNFRNFGGGEFEGSGLVYGLKVVPSVVLLGGQFLFTCSDNFAVSFYVSFSHKPQCTASQTNGWTVKVKVKVKADIALHGNPISELRDVTCHIRSHSVNCHPTQVNAPRLTPAMYSIYLPRRDERLSWPSWLDSAPAESRTSDLTIMSPTLNRCTTKTTNTDRRTDIRYYHANS